MNSESPADSAAYFQALERFFSQESAFTHFTPVIISDDTADNIDIISGYGRKGSDAYAPRCNIAINQLACVQVKKYKSVFLVSVGILALIF
ncbi:hypothetical protein EON63_21595 [archaeon]|nr:MAG: hypothetical protein EON63_21595 [archaeon]